MKKVLRISLHNLCKAELSKREETQLKGGLCPCVGICPCAYEGGQNGPGDSYYGGSSTNDNANANAGINGNSNTL
jgi:natural product precursor